MPFELNYRQARAEDAVEIALIHAQSWQLHYRNIWSDEFLDNLVLPDRLRVWHDRLQVPKPNQQVYVATTTDPRTDPTTGTAICGFACTYANDDPQWGHLLDNLHVLPQFHGHGIGKTLMKLAATWAQDQNPDSYFYLWVLEENMPARRFYDHLGAENVETIREDDPHAGSANSCRYVWRNVQPLCV